MAALRLPKVLFVTGSFRSGSTVLGNVLGELDGYVSVGEVLSLWRNGLGGGRCGCGELVEDCEFWTEVRRAGFGDREPSRKEMLTFERRHLMNWPPQLI